MIVIFDTNIWKQNLYLRSPASAAVALYLKNKGAQVGLPEVIRLEVEAHLRTDIRTYRDRLKSDHDRLLALFGKLDDILLPTDVEIEELARNFFNRSGFEFVEVPFTFAAARDSFIRTIEKRPPSQGSQQFKDGVIWANCMALAETDEVILVTEDNAFYEGGKTANGLSAKLAAETATSIHPIRILPSLPSLLDEIREPISAPFETLIAEIRKGLGQIDGFMVMEEMEETGSTVTAQYFASEIPNLVYVTFELRINGTSVRVTSPTIEMIIRGECGWNVTDDTYSDFQPSDVQVLRFDPDGNEVSDAKHYYLLADGLLIGRKPAEYRLREQVG